MFDVGVVDGARLIVHAIYQHARNSEPPVARDNFVDSTISNILFVKYYAIASITLLYFDHVITFPAEVRHIWCTRFTGATLLFFLNRYVPFFGYVPIILSLFNPPWSIDVHKIRTVYWCLERVQQYYSHNSHHGTIIPLKQFSLLTSFPMLTVILVLRTYALYSRALWVLILTSSFGGASIAIGSWSTSSVKGELFSFQPIVVCVPMLQNNQGLKLAWIAIFAFDTLIFFLTIARTYWYIKAQANQHIHSNLVILVVRDGSMYYLVMSIINAANFILSQKLNNPFFAQANGTNSILAHVISVTMMSRLLLNLRDESVRYRQRSASGDRSTTAQTLTDTDLVFTTRIIGNLTAELDYEFDSTGSSHRGNHSRSTEEHYGSYGDDDTDDIYELQSLSTRSGFTGRAGTVDLEITSMTASGSASGSGSGSASNQSVRGGRIKGKGRARDKSRLAWVQPDNIASDRGTMNELPPPATAAESDSDLHAGILFHRSRSPQALSPTLSQPSPLSPYPRGHGLEPGIDDDVDDTQRTEYPVERVPLRASGVGETLEMTRLERRTRGQDSSGDHDLYHSHYRQPPRKNS